MAEFKKRVYGCAIVKAINSNYNADFSGQPRTLPDGIVYATDKAFKYSIKKFLKDAYENVAHPTNPVECCADANPKTMLPNDT